MAQGLRLRSEHNTRHSARQKEIRRRTFWACVMLDRLVSTCTFRTQTIEASLVAIRLPGSAADFAFGRTSMTPSLAEMADHPARHDVLTYYVYVTVTWGRIAEWYVNLGRHTKMTDRRRLVGYRQAMQNLRHNLPDELQWNPNNYEAHRALGTDRMLAELHVMIEHALFMNEQEYLPQVQEPYRLSLTLEEYDPEGIALNHVDSDVIRSCISHANNVDNLATGVQQHKISKLILRSSDTFGCQCHAVDSLCLPYVAASARRFTSENGFRLCP